MPTLQRIPAQTVVPRREEMSSVFISHSRVDAELTKNLATMLRNIGETPVVMEYVSEGAEKVPPYARIKQELPQIT